MLRSILSALVGAALPFAACAQTYTAGTIRIDQAWARATAAGAQAGGGYLKLTNGGSAPDRLVAARSSAADRVELHEMKMDGNVMRMRELERGVDLPPGATVELKPGGYHVMFMGLKAPFARDARVPLTLVFEKAGTIDVELKVEAMGAAQPAHRH
jgi:copper(I)-binding protein